MRCAGSVTKTLMAPVGEAGTIAALDTTAPSREFRVETSSLMLPAGQSDLTQPVVSRVGNVDVSGSVDYDAVWSIQGGVGGKPTVARVTARPGSRQRVDELADHLPNAVTGEFADVEGAVFIYCNARRLHQSGFDGVAAVAPPTEVSVARDGCDDACGGDLSHAIVSTISDVDVSEAIDSHSVWRMQLGCSGGNRLAARSEPTASCKDTGDAGW